jgi:hypothetical protein
MITDPAFGPLRAPRPCWLYRHFDANELLLYVGIAYDTNDRRRQHEQKSRWFPLVCRETTTRFPDRTAARAAEVAAIADEQPLFNIADVPDPVAARARRFDYLVRIGWTRHLAPTERPSYMDKPTGTIEWDDMVELLALAATYDQRKIAELDVRAWVLAAGVAGWTDAAAVSRVIVEHYAAGADRPRITPAAITDRLRDIRRAAAESFVDPVIPDDLRAVDYPAWYRRQRDEHIGRALRAWANTGEMPRPAAVEPAGNRLAEIVAQAPEAVRPALEASMTKIDRRQP